MPTYRVLNEDIEGVVAELEKSEEIVAIVNAGDNALLVFTKSKRTKPGAKETR